VIFTSLAIFSGGFTLEAVEAVCSLVNVNKSIADLIISLVDKILLQPLSDGRGEYRFSMLATIRQVALNHLCRSKDEAEIRDRHLAYFLGFADRGGKEMRGYFQVDWIERIENEHDNFQAALDRSVSNQNTKAVLCLMCALRWPWEVRGHYDEALCWLNKIHSLPN
jgi:predicted ATPase